MAERIWHIARLTDWESALADGEYRVSTRGARLEQVGFIHASFWHQLSGVAEFVFAGEADDLVVLEIDTEALTGHGLTVKVEVPEHGAEGYPHLYGPLPVDAVVAVHPAGFDARDRFAVGKG